MFGRIHQCSHLVLNFSFLGGFWLLILYLSCYSSVHVFYSSWMSFGNLRISKNVFISSRLVNLLAYNCSQYPHNPFNLCKVLIFISDFSYLHLLFLFLVKLKLANFVNIFKKILFFLFHWVFTVFLFSIYLCSNLLSFCSFLPVLGLVCSSFF